MVSFIKAIKSFLLIFALFLLQPQILLGADEFLVDSKVEYSIGETGKTSVKHEIKLENAFSSLYATSYTLSLENIDAQNIHAYYDNGTKLEVVTEKDGEKLKIKINFPDASVGKGKVRHFYVGYDNSSFAVRTGEVWEISIPRLSSGESFRNYEVVLKVPTSLGFEAYISPRPQSTVESESEKTYIFTKDELTKTGVSAGFGQFQVFNFALNYHLENPLNRKAETEISLPPDTAFQKVYIRSLIPEPTNVRIDEDGNWLAIYELDARERIDVTASGEVQIFSSFRSFPKPTDEILSKNLMETQYWQVNDPQIRALAQQYETPREIYDYVSQTLQYDYDRVRPNVDRLGALGALDSPLTAICMEFTDLFVAIARAAGIPAREVNGYAYTENPQIQPLGLVADVLHAWPEYWDAEKGVWIPIDPTWAATTGGVNFFDKLDLRHFTFVNHGTSDTKPYPPGSYKLGTNPQKDVFVSFGKLSLEQTPYPEVSATFKQGIPFLNSNLHVKIKNPGPSAFYSVYPTVYFDSKESYRDYDEVLPPFGTYEMNVKVPFSFLGKDTPGVIKVVVNGSQVEVPTNKNKVIVSSLLGLFIVFILILLIVMSKTKRINIFPKGLNDRLFGKIRWFNKNDKSNSETSQDSKG